MSRSPHKSHIRQLAKSLGFSECRFTTADVPDLNSDALGAFVEAGFHGEMGWMAETLERRMAPRNMWQNAKSAVVLAMNYGPQSDPLEILEKPEKAAISVYAQNRDYHDIVKGKLKQIAQKIASVAMCEVKVFVDTAPLMEKPLAHQAGIGWQGKHTNLVSREHGSWLFLGVILTDHAFEPDDAETDHCGTCRACLDICPTDAFPKPYSLDARRCISYLTIEHSAPIPHEFRKPIGNRIYGCDDCLAVCPWNKFASLASEQKLHAREELKEPDLADLAALDDAEFRKLFSGSPVKRIGRARFLRNVLIAIGNSNTTKLCDAAMQCLDDDDALVRGAAVWAISQLMPQSDFRQLKNAHMQNETAAEVIAEWKMAMTGFESNSQ